MFGIEYANGPDPDRDPSDPELTEPEQAPHETAGVLRMYRHGATAPKITKILGISKEQLMHDLTVALDDETEAHRLGQPIHDDRIAKVYTTEKYAKDVLAGEFLIGSTFIESVDYEPGTGHDPGSITIWFIDGTKVFCLPYFKVRVYREPVL